MPAIASVASSRPETERLLRTTPGAEKEKPRDARRDEAKARWALVPYLAALIFSGLVFTCAFAFTAHLRDPPAATPAATLVEGYVPGLDVVTAADALARQLECAAVMTTEEISNAERSADEAESSVSSRCAAIAGCDFWGGACGMDCGRLATAEACGASDGCSWDETHRHCGWAAPACAASSGAPEHCDASAFCQYDAGARACVDATYACEDLGDAASCARSAAPQCAWNEEGGGSGSGGGACADLRQCETIKLPRDCAAHRGCAFSQSGGACVSLSVVAEDKPMCVANEDCAVADTFCNLDFGNVGYCQNCLPIEGAEVCDDVTRVAGVAAGMCKRGCFGAA